MEISRYLNFKKVTMKNSFSFFTLIITTVFALSSIPFQSHAQSKKGQSKAKLISTENSENLPPSAVDYEEFLRLSAEIRSYRQKRMVDLKTFKKLSEKKGVIILDTRSKYAFDKKHLKGAVHLNFSDFTEGKLAQIIPSKTTTVLIYCNNNFRNDPENFAMKSMPLALNIPTFINLYGYGYTNIYELGNLVNIEHPDLEFEGNLIINGSL